MPKRKLEDLIGADAKQNPLSSRNLHSQRQQLEGLIEQGKKALFRSLKVARGFERQKLGRRQKTAKAESNDADSTRLNGEVVALKNLDIASIAGLHLYKTLTKTKSIASSPSFPKYVQTSVAASRKPLDSASANVQARLFKSTPVQSTIAKSLSEIRVLLGVPEVQVAGKKRLRAKDYANGPVQKNNDAIPQQQEKPFTESASPEDDKGEGLPDSGEIQQHFDSEASDDNDSNYNMYASRLAASSSSEASFSDTPTTPLNPSLIPSSSFRSLRTPPPDPPSPPTPPNPQPPPTTKSTTFLPSLSLGGYISGSESASSLSDTEHPEARKNRRGQRARRMLWEKKFGRNAKHLRNEQPQSGNRDEGWDLRRGASEGRGKGRGRGRGGFGGGRGERGREKKGGRGPMTSGANSDPVGARKGKVEGGGGGSLHPSWEAAKRAKEQKLGAPFQGKKVVFD